MAGTQKSIATAPASEDPLRYAMGEWLRDAGEVRDLMHQFGIEPSGKASRDRERLLKALEGSEPEEVASMLYGVARGFALMLDDIVRNCARWNVSIAGELQLPKGCPLVRNSALDTSWAHADGNGESLMPIPSNTAAHAERLVSLTAGISVQALVHLSSEYVPTDVGLAMQASRDPYLGAIVEMRSNPTHRPVETSWVSATDISVLAACTSVLSEMQTVALQLQDVGVSAATGRAAASVQKTSSALSGHEQRYAACTPILAGVLPQLQEILAQLRTSVRTKGAARRVARGLGNFVQSEFWRSRWRLFELWVLIRCMGVMEKAGFEHELLDVQNDTWNLSYGRSTRSIARYRRGSTEMALFYQLFEEGDECDAMPDIALCNEQGGFIFVVDPKHGPSHHRTVALNVLNKYADHFKAVVTAVTNFTHKASYEFDVETTAQRSKILVSGLMPGSVALRRLELRLEEAVLSEVKGEVVSSQVSSPKPKRKAGQSPSLVYWASGDNEVDERAGAWALSHGGALQRLSELSKLVSPADVVSFSGNPSGTSCLLTTEKSFVFASHRAEKLVVRERDTSKVLTFWCRCNRHVALVGMDTISLFDASGEKIIELPKRLTYGGALVAWSTGCNRLYVVDSSRDIWWCQIDAAQLKWAAGKKVEFDFTNARISFDGRTSRYCIVSGSHSRFVGHLVEGDDPTLEPAPPGSDEPLASSMDGKKLVFSGPKSLGRSTLFSALDGRPTADLPPLLRIPRAQIREIQWSPAGDRFALFAGEQVYVCVPGEKYGMPIALSRHAPRGFAWLDAQFLAKWA